MVMCSAYKCECATYRNIAGITFHRFPKDKELRSAWIREMRLKEFVPNPSSVVCSKHFEAHLLERSGFRTRLRKDAVPTIFTSLPTHLQNKPKAPRIFCKDARDLLKDTSIVRLPMLSTSTQTEAHEHQHKTETLKAKIVRKNRKIKALLERCRRLRIKVYQYSNIISELQIKNLSMGMFIDKDVNNEDTDKDIKNEDVDKDIKNEDTDKE